MTLRTFAVHYLRKPTAQDRQRMQFMTRMPTIELFGTEESANAFAAEIRRKGGKAHVGEHGKRVTEDQLR